MKTVKFVNPCKHEINTGYDIVKVNDGEIKAESREDESAIFILVLAG
jgi:hypothetical protein